jgi:3D (Asp-Asp-Asp) domain-containing protein
MTRDEKRMALISAILLLAIITPLMLLWDHKRDVETRPITAHVARASVGVSRDEILMDMPKAEPMELLQVQPTEETPEETTAPTEEPQSVEPVLESLGTFKLTAYCPCSKCCGEWADGITYTGTIATADRTVAVDPSVIPLGSTLYINGQAYIAEDIGGAIKNNRIDVFFDTHEAALQFGVLYADVAIQR